MGAFLNFGCLSGRRCREVGALFGVYKEVVQNSSVSLGSGPEQGDWRSLRKLLAREDHREVADPCPGLGI